ncbi:AAA family ATPase [Variovorax sp. RHLX14]
MARQADPLEKLGLAPFSAPAAECEEPGCESVWSCKHCSGAKAQRVVTRGSWHWACDTCGTRVDDNEIDTSSASAIADPFAHLDRAMAKTRNENQQCLDFEHAEGPPPDRVYNFTMNRLCEVRPIAERRGIELIFDNFRCDACDCKDLRREFGGNCWSWKCQRCGAFKSAVMAIKQLNDLQKAAPTVKVVSHEERDAGVEIFSLDDITAAAENVALLSSDENSRSRLKATLARLLETSTVRPYVVPNPAWQGQLDEMREAFPNFQTAIDELIEPSFAIAAAGGRARPAPLLLVGPPGIGKSYFSSLLAGVLKTPMFKVDLASATAGSSIDGLAVHWGNSTPGEVFRTLAFGRAGVKATACPVGFLDEIDKVGGNKCYDPLGPLYSLLEVESSRNFEDQSLPGIRIDASHVRWIGCCNELDMIPKPILSRFHIVHVIAPTGAETLRMYERIFARVVKDTGLYDFGNQISKSVLVNAVERFSARDFKTRSTMAIGRALARNRHSVETCDFENAPPPTLRKMGF